MKLILGSSSKYRKEMLENAGYFFSVVSPDVDEDSIFTDDPYRRPLILARAKADNLAEKIKESALVIACDVVVISKGRLYEKPKTEAEALGMLNKWGTGVEIDVVCGVVLLNTGNGKRYEGTDIAKIFFKEFPKEMLKDFMKHGEPLARAGAFSMQHPIMNPYVDRVEGDKTTVIGLSLSLLEKLLIEAGYKKD